MSATFPSLDHEALKYFLLHSGVFIIVLGTGFFLLGFWCGRRVPLRATTANTTNLPPPSAPTHVPTSQVAEVVPIVKTEAVVPPPIEAAKPATAAEEAAPSDSPPLQEAKIEPTPEIQAEATHTETTEPESILPDATTTSDAAPENSESADTLSLLKEPAPELLPEPLPLFPEAEPEPVSAMPSLPQDGVLRAITRSHGVQLPPADAFSFLLLDAPPPPPRRRRPLPSPILFATHDGDMSRDDLTRVRGITAELEKKLNTLGVRRWHQIAAWTPAEVRLVSSRLAFKDRIEREEWQSQARALAEDAEAPTSATPEEAFTNLQVQV